MVYYNRVIKMKVHTITKGEYEAIQALRKQNQNKRIDKRLQVLLLRYEGLADQAIGDKLDFHCKRVSQLCAEFKRVGLEEYARHKYGGNHRNMSQEAEQEFLEQFKETAQNGQIPTVAEIGIAYAEQTGKNLQTNSTIYGLLHRHGWRTIIPQKAHPGKASDEAIEASKKLTLKSKK